MNHNNKISYFNKISSWIYHNHNNKDSLNKRKQNKVSYYNKISLKTFHHYNNRINQLFFVKTIIHNKVNYLKIYQANLKITNSIILIFLMNYQVNLNQLLIKIN